MSGNKEYLLVTGLLFLQLAGWMSGQAQTDTAHKKNRGEYALVLYAGGGISFYSGDPGTPSGLNAVEVNKVYPSATLRVMWHPDHLLRVGLETGWNTFYSYKVNNNGITGSVHVRATPILLVFSMPIKKRINVFAGTGGYLVHSRLDYEVVTVSKTWSLGWMAAASYTYPLGKDLGIAAEFKWQQAYETRDANFNVQLQLRWKFLKW